MEPNRLAQTALGTHDLDTHNLGRRGLLSAAAATCAACALAACGTDSGTGSPATAQAPSDGASPSKSLETSSKGAVQGGKAVPKSSIPVGGGLIVTDGEIVITQPTAGDYKGFTSICTHQGCPVTSVEGGVITCNCHGSQFSITDGSVVRGPASEPLASKPVTVSGDQIDLP